MATYIVDPAGGGTHTTIAAAIAAATSGTDLIQITGGTYDEGVASAANVTIELLGDVVWMNNGDDNFDIGHAVTVLKTGYTCRLENTTATKHCIRLGIVGAADFVAWDLELYATAGEPLLSHQTNPSTCRLNRSWIHGSATYGFEVKAGTTTLVGCVVSDMFVNNVFRVSGAADLWLINSVIGNTGYEHVKMIAGASGTSHVVNSILLGNATVGTGTDILDADAGTLNIDHSMILPNGTGLGDTSGETDAGGNLGYAQNAEDVAGFKTFRRPTLGSVSIMLDDWQNNGDLDELRVLAEAAGLKVSFAVSSRPLGVELTDANYAYLAELQAAGHTVAGHGRTAAALTDDNEGTSDLPAFTLSYTGGGSAASLFYTVSTTTFRVAITGEADVSYDVTDPAYNTMKKLYDALNAHGSFSATAINGASQYVSPETLAAVSGQDIKTAPYAVVKDEARFFDYELVGVKEDFAAHGITLTSYVYSVYTGNAAARAAALAAGYNGARGNIIVGRNRPESWQPFGSFAVQTSNAAVNLGTDHKRRIRALLEWAGFAGIPLQLYDHDFATSTSKAYWQDIIAAIVDVGLPSKGYDEQCIDALDVLTSVDDDEYTSDFISTDRAWVAKLTSNSALIAAGTPPPVSSAVGIDGEPFSTWEASIGSVQSKDTPFHPTNL